MGLAPVPRARYWQSVCQRRSDNNVESYSAKDRYRRGDIDGVVGGPIYGACAYFHLSKVTNFFLFKGRQWRAKSVRKSAESARPLGASFQVLCGRGDDAALSADSVAIAARKCSRATKTPGSMMKNAASRVARHGDAPSVLSRNA
jgi:hypothetical protein